MRGISFNHDRGLAARAIRLTFVVLILAFGMGLATKSAAAAPSEQFVAENVQRGLAILNNKQISKDERRAQFREFLLGLTDIKQIAEYTLGQYRRTATPEQINDYDSAFKDYALAVYQSYFTKYTGQTLKITGSYDLTPGETIVKTTMVDPNGKPNAKPLEVDFRVLSQNGRMVVVDFSVEGVWVRELEKNDFTSFLGANNGDVAQLTANLKAKSQTIR